MQSIILVVHLFIAVALVAMVLLQRSEGGALGMGGGSGGGMGGFMSGRGAANMLTRTTAFLAAAFFATSITLTLLAGGGTSSSVLDTISTTPAGNTAQPGGLKLGDERTQGTDAPAAPGAADNQEPAVPLSQ